MVLAARSAPLAWHLPTAPITRQCGQLASGQRYEGRTGPRHQASVKQALKCQVSSATTTSRQLDQRYDERDAKHASVPLRRVRTGELRWEKFLYELKAGQRAASGRPRPAAAPTGLRVVASPPNGPAGAHAPRVLDPSRRVQRHPGRLRLDRHPHGARAQLGRHCSVRPLGPVQPRQVSCNFLAQVVAAIELRRPLPRVRWTFANEAGGAPYDGRRKELPWFATASLLASRITPDSAGGPDNCNVCSTGRRSLNLPPDGDHVALVDLRHRRSIRPDRGDRTRLPSS
jgi:hypothetical protein